VSKRATLLFIAILAVSSLTMVESAFAQSIAKPSVPEFTVNLIDYNRIEVKIKNQPFTPYNNTEGDEVNLYYTVRVKDHFGEDWSTLVTYSESGAERIPQSSSEYTVVTIPQITLMVAQWIFKSEQCLGIIMTRWQVVR